MSDCSHFPHIRTTNLTPTAAAAWERRLKFRRDLSTRAVRDDGINLKRKLMPVEPQPLVPQEAVSAPVLAADGDFIVDVSRRLDFLLGPVGGFLFESRYTIREIQDVVCIAATISRVEIMSPLRSESLVRARQIAMALCKALTARSFSDIGQRFGGRDHTTVLHATRKMQPVIDDISDILDVAPLRYIAEIALRRCDQIIPYSKIGKYHQRLKK